MNPTSFAMRRPVTILMLVVALISGGVLAFNRMRVDIFPPLNTPKIYVFLDYIGMSPDQIEGFIVNQLELYFQYVDGIEVIDTRNIQQVALCQLSFFPGTDMGQAMAQVVAMSDRAMSWMPKGTLPPMIMRMDAGSVPVGYLVFESEQTSLGAMGDLAQNVIRPLVQKYVPGTVAISPFGPNMRSIVVSIDPHKLLNYNLTPAEVIDALATGNTIIPAGNIYIKDSMPVAPTTRRWSTSSTWGISRSASVGTSTCGTWPPSRTIPTSPTAMPWSTARSRSICRSSRKTRAPRSPSWRTFGSRCSCSATLFQRT